MTQQSLRKRSETDGNYPFRNQSRYEFNDGSWYFNSREGLFGPFGSKEEAETEVMLILRNRAHLDSFGFDRQHRFTQAA